MPEYSRKAMNDVQLQNGQNLDLGRVVVSAGGSITGTCKEATGQPFSDADVQAALDAAIAQRHDEIRERTAPVIHRGLMEEGIAGT